MASSLPVSEAPHHNRAVTAHWERTGQSMVATLVGPVRLVLVQRTPCLRRRILDLAAKPPGA